jgi:hypothetical protein
VKVGDVVMVLNTDGDVAFVGRYEGWDEDELMVLVSHDLKGADSPMYLSVAAVVPFDDARIPSS